jgi:hypothetical protein
VDYVPGLTSLQGYAARIEVGKRAGLHWRGEGNVTATSPGYEINDVGFQTTVDRLGTDISVTYVENLPGRRFRNYRLTASTSGDWNYGGDIIAGRASLNWNGQLTNYWNFGGNEIRARRWRVTAACGCLYIRSRAELVPG